MDSNDTKGMLGCLALVLLGAFALFASIAIGIFFGVGFGLLAYALFLLFAIVCVLRALSKADGK